MIQIPKQLKDCKFCRVAYKTKKPFEQDWNNKPYTYNEIQQFLDNENYGVLCDSKLRALDDDTPGKILIDKFHKSFGRTFRSRDHLCIRFKTGEEKKIIFKDKDGNHLGELQGAGQMIVGTGSIHPSGEVYELKDDTEIITIDYNLFKEAFKDYIQEDVDVDIKKQSVEDYEKIIQEFVPKWLEGSRQELALSLAGYLRKEKRMGSKTIGSIIKEICRRTNDNEVDMRLQAVVETFKKNEDEVKGYTGVKNIIEEERIEDYLILKGINSKTGREEYNVDIDKVADYIEKKLVVRTIYGLKEETIEIYRDGIWTTKGKGVVKAEVEKLLKNYSKNNIVSEVLEKVKRRTEIEREEADKIPEFKRCVNNGVLDLEDPENIKFLPHSKEYNFRTKFPMDYDPKADCPEYKKFVKETFYEEDIPVVQEWDGLHLVRRYVKKKAAIFYGPKHTGKTVYVNALTIFVGGNVSGLSLQEISRAKPFDLVALKNKDANICDDLSSQDLKATGAFKMVIGDGFINSEHKFGDKDRFRNTAKNTNTCNKMPSPGEDIDDDAYYDRLKPIPVDNVVPIERQDEHLIDKITTPGELSGRLNWAIEGYKRLMKNKDFSNPKTAEEIKFLMMQNGNSLARFAAEALKQKDGCSVTKECMYQVYCKWCMNHKPQLSPDSKDKLGKNLTKFAAYTQSCSNGAKRYWSNVEITDTYYTFQNNMRDILEVDNSDNNIIYNISEHVIPVINNDTNDSIKQKENIEVIKIGKGAYNPQKKIIEENKKLLDEIGTKLDPKLLEDIKRIKEQTQ